MRTIEIIWGTSRGRNTYGYTTCTLRENGKRIAACNGGGYDMRGTVLGNWLTYAYRDRLLALRPQDMPKNSHWEPDHRAFVCRSCAVARLAKDLEPVRVRVPGKPHEFVDEYPKCPECGEEMARDNHAGKTIDDGRGLYGLTFHDPNYNPGKATIGSDTTDRTLGGAEGMTVEQAEQAGKSIGLERYQAVYRASSKVPTERHTIPSIDGACGVSSVEAIAKAIGVSFRQVVNRAKLDVYEVIDAKNMRGSNELANQSLRRVRAARRSARGPHNAARWRCEPDPVPRVLCPGESLPGGAWSGNQSAGKLADSPMGRGQSLRDRSCARSSSPATRCIASSATRAGQARAAACPSSCRSPASSWSSTCWRLSPLVSRSTGSTGACASTR
jgi:rubredoxin